MLFFICKVVNWLYCLPICIFIPMKYILYFFLLLGIQLKAQQPATQTTLVDIIRIEAVLTPDLDQATIKGQVAVSFIPTETVQTVSLDAIAMQVSAVSANAKVTATASQILIHGAFTANQLYTVAFEYTAQPKQTMYVVDHFQSKQLWTQGQGKYTSHWLPSIDDMNEKIEFDISIQALSTYKAISNGQLVASKVGDSLTLSSFDMKYPMSSYLVAMAIGDYQKETVYSASGVAIHHYYYPSDTLKIAPTYRHTTEIFDFFENTLEVPYPWQNYKQVPVKDFLYAGMENTGCTIFSDSFMIDEMAFDDRNYVNVNAHELAHQWFGNLVTETKSEHHWLHEGFATYYALLAERHIFGDDYFYFKLYQTAEQLKNLSDQGKGQALVAAGGSSLTYYQKGAWAIHILKELIGEAAFAKAVKGYLTTYAFQTATTQDFMSEVAKVTDIDLTSFEKNWLYQSAFQADDALDSLKKSAFMQSYFLVQALRAKPLSQKRAQLLELIKTSNTYLAQEAVYQLSEAPISETAVLYNAALERSDLLIRQAVAESVSIENIPKIPRFKNLLDDASYVTQEIALYKLWIASNAHPDGVQQQRAILDQTKAIFGFNDANVRSLWLALSLITPGYEDQEAAMTARYEELKGYTAPDQPFQRRLQAFQYLAQIQLWEAESLVHLIQASVHINWRFRESARQLLQQLLKDDRWKKEVITLKPKLEEKQIAYLERIGL